MKIVKIYNNNIVSAKNGNLEVIAIGKGIGYNKKINDEVDENKIEKVYSFENKQQKQLHQLMERIPILYFRISEVIASKAMEKLHIQLSSQILISLSDHIAYAIERKRKGLLLPNLMLNEIRALYRQEYKIGLWAIKLIEVNVGTTLDENEAGYIAMHIVNATIGNSSQHSQISKILRFIKDVQRVVESCYNIELDTNNLACSRFVTHLKFLGQHIFSDGKEPSTKENVADLYAFLIKSNDTIESCINQIEEVVYQNYQYRLLDNDKVYLMIHINKMVS